MQCDAPVYTSHTAFFGPMQQRSRKDVVLAELNGERRVCQVWFHVLCGGVCYTCVSPWVGTGNNMFRTSDEPALLTTQCILDTCVYSLVGDLARVVPAFEHAA